MPAGRSPPLALAPDGSVAMEPGGEFTDRQMAQLRSVIGQCLRALVQSEFGAMVSPSPSCCLQPSTLTSAVDGGIDTGRSGTKSSDPTPRSQSIPRSSLNSQSTRRRSNISNTQDDRITRKVEITGVECSNSSQVRSIVLNGRRQLKRMASKLVLVHGNPWFDFALGVLIIANSVVIGIETQLRMESERELPSYLFWIESVFLVCFVFELIVHWLADGRANLSNGWFWFDFFLVVTGVVYTWIIGPILAATSQEVPVLSQILTLRIFRLLRLVRALRLVEQFKELWKLCSGLLRSARTMLSVLLLVLIAMFVFACLGADLITKSPKLNSNEETRAIIEMHFSSLMVTLLTLMQFANADSIGSIYLPLCKEEPALVPYFLGMWLVVTVALMNLVTALIVENAMADGREDAEQRQTQLRVMLKNILPEIEDVFDKLDVDNSNSLDLAELHQAVKFGKLELPEVLKEYVDPSKLIDVFDLLDADQSGTIERAEFFDGICSLVVSSVPVETTQTLQLLRRSYDVLLDTRSKVEQLSGGGLDHVYRRA